MDLDLGPYASVYKKEVERINKLSKRANFETLHKKQNIRFLQNSDSKRKDRFKQNEQHRKERRSQLFMNSRKPNMVAIANELNMLVHDDENNGEISAVEVQEASSYKNGDQNIKTPATIAKVNENVSNIMKKGIKAGLREPQPSTSKGRPPVLAKDSRKEQLMKWKREKEAATDVAKKNQKQPFKAGATAAGSGAPANKNINVSAPTRTKNISSTPATGNIASKVVGKQPIAASRQAPLTSTSQPKNCMKATVGPGPKMHTIPPACDGVRRVTRAMAAKVQAGMSVPEAAGRGPIPTLPIKPALQKLKHLNINEKPAPSKATDPDTGRINGLGKGKGITAKGQSSKSGPTPATSKASASKKGPASNGKGSKDMSNSKSSSDSCDSSGSNSAENSIVNTDVTSKQPASIHQGGQEQQQVVKKWKPKAIDHTYIEYNCTFSSACLKLRSYDEQWRKILEESADIPEKVHGEILSSLGKVKLLLQSKLPQFGQLLFSYLCHGIDPNPVLPCDLQGWWDVVSIQLEAVDEIFKNLDLLKQNDWEIKPAEVVPSAEIKKSEKAVSRPLAPPKVKAQASGGLKAFLANRRKQIQNPDTVISDEAPRKALEPPPLPNDKESEIKSDSSETEMNKTFDGGFFAVNSPKPCLTPTRRILELRRESTKSQSTGGEQSPKRSSMWSPNSRRSSTCSVASQRRVSMSILRVRTSLGPLNRIGVTQLGTESDRQSLNSSTASTATFLSSLTSQEDE